MKRILKIIGIAIIAFIIINISINLFINYWVCDPVKNPKGRFMSIADFLEQPFEACSCMPIE